MDVKIIPVPKRNRSIIKNKSRSNNIDHTISSSNESNTKTHADNLISEIKNNNNQIKLSELRIKLQIEPSKLEYWIKMLQSQGILKIIYPTNIFAEPVIVLNQDRPKDEEKQYLPKNKKLVESYVIEIDSVKANVNIWDMPSKDMLVYDMIFPKIGQGTVAILNSLVNELAQKIPLEIEDVTDTHKIKKLKKRFYVMAKQEISSKLPRLKEDVVDTLAGIILHRVYGLGEMELILNDDWLEEISINSSKDPLLVYHKKYGWLESTHYVHTEEETYNFASQIGRKVGREINSLNPIMDAHLLSGDRAAATLFPISTMGNTITIRRFPRNPWTIMQLTDPTNNCLSTEIGALLWLAVQYELNILVAGGTASGKTSVLSSICATIPATQRVISIEDTREITLPKALRKNWVSLTTRNANPEGKGEITMLDLMVASLRMRPDRLIVGEIRKKEQAETMFEAMHTGHSVYCTMHADTVSQVRRRLLEPPFNIPKSEAEALHLILVQYRDRRKGMRRTLELAEVLSDSDDFNLNYLYRWRPRKDTFEKANESIRIVEELNLHTGMTPIEINQDLKEKETILQWMQKNKLKDVDAIGQVMRLYYKRPDELLKAIQKKKKASDLFSEQV